MTDVLQQAADALEQCGEMFRIGNQDGLISFEELAREFNKRQHIAKDALSAIRAEQARMEKLGEGLELSADDRKRIKQWAKGGGPPSPADVAGADDRFVTISVSVGELRAAVHAQAVLRALAKKEANI